MNYLNMSEDKQFYFIEGKYDDKDIDENAFNESYHCRQNNDCELHSKVYFQDERQRFA